MKHTNLALVALAAVGIAIAPVDTTIAQQTLPGPGTPVSLLPENPVKCEPLLLFDQSADAWYMPRHTALAVYNDGLVNFARTGYGDHPPVVWSERIPKRNVHELWKDLVSIGVFTLEDQAMVPTDTPASTVTVFHGATEAVAHTFTFFLPQGRYGDVLRIIETFITDPIG